MLSLVTGKLSMSMSSSLNQLD